MHERLVQSQHRRLCGNCTKRTDTLARASPPRPRQSLGRLCYDRSRNDEKRAGSAPGRVLARKVSNRFPKKPRPLRASSMACYLSHCGARGRFVRVVSWNLRKSPAGLGHLQNHLRPDIALLQEAPARREASGHLGLRDVQLVASPPEYHDTVEAENFTTATIRSNDLEIRVVSLYSRPIRGRKFHLALGAMLDALSHELGRGSALPMLVGGDFNATTQLVGEGSRCGDVLDRLGRSGFVDALRTNPQRRKGPDYCSCGSAPSCMHVPTFRRKHKDDWAYYQIDNIFISKPLAKYLTDAFVDEPDLHWGLSDHRPVVVDFDFRNIESCRSKTVEVDP